MLGGSAVKGAKKLLGFSLVMNLCSFASGLLLFSLV
jgi:hypothetical protein